MINIVSIYNLIVTIIVLMFALLGIFPKDLGFSIGDTGYLQFTALWFVGMISVCILAFKFNK
jgi:hypothetical protein